MLDRRAIYILIVTFAFLYVYQYHFLPRWFPPRKPAPQQTPRQNKQERPPDIGPDTGKIKKGETGAKEIETAKTETETGAVENGKDQKLPADLEKKIEKEAEPEPLKEIKVVDKVLALPPSSGSNGQEKDFLRAVFTNRGAALKRMEILDYDESANSKNPLPLIQEVQPKLHSLVLKDVEGAIDLDTRVYEIEKDETKSIPSRITFLAQFPRARLKVRKSYEIEEGQRHLKFNLQLINESDKPRELKLSLSAAAGVTPEMPVCGAVHPSKAPPDINTSAIIGTDKGGSISVERYSAANAKSGQPEIYDQDPVAFVGCETRYFVTALRAPDQPPGWKRSALIEKVGANNIMTSLQSSVIKLAPGETQSFDFILFAGPKTLEALNPYPKLQATFDYGWFGAIARPLIGLLRLFYSFTKSIGGYGLAIIFLTLIVRLALHPLSRKGQISMHRMSKLNPEMQKLRAKYAEDKQRLNQEMMTLYREHKVNPLGGCLPLLLQFPIFISLYRVIQYSIELRGKSFLWIQDLSQADSLFCFPRPLPLVGVSAFNILPFLMIFLWVYQARQTPKSDDPQQAQMQKMMQIMPIIFGVLFYSMPSGLLLYFVTSSGLGLLESKMIKKRLEKEDNTVKPKPTGKIVPKKKRRDKFGRRN